MLIYREWTLGDGITLGDAYLLGQLIGIPGNVDTLNADAFRRAARGSIREPSFSVFIERTGDITDYVKSYTFDRHIYDSLSEPTPSTGWLNIADKRGEFVEDGKSIFRVGDKVKIWAGFEGTNIPRFTGVVRESKINTTQHEINIGIGDYAYVLKNVQTSGDYGDYNTPKLLVDELLDRQRLSAPVWENESGAPSTFEFGDTDLERRSYWAIIHGACSCIFYVPYFDENGLMKCRRRDSFIDYDEFELTDTNIMDITHIESATLINSKSIEHSPEMPTCNQFLLSDGVRWGESSLICENKRSIDLYGEATDYEAEELLYGWSNIIQYGPQVLEYYSYPRQLYGGDVPAFPEVGLMYRIWVNSQRRNIAGWFTVIGIQETHAPANFWQRLTLLSEPMRL